MKFGSYELMLCIEEVFVVCSYFTTTLSPKYNKRIQFLISLILLVLVKSITPSFSVEQILMTILFLFFFLCFFKDTFKRKMYVFLSHIIVLSVSLLTLYIIHTFYLKGMVGFKEILIGRNSVFFLLYLVVFSVFSAWASQIFKKTNKYLGIILIQAIIGVGEVLLVLSVARMSTQLSAARITMEIIDFTPSNLFTFSVICMIYFNASIGEVASYLFLSLKANHNNNGVFEWNNMAKNYYEISVENEKKIHEIKHELSNQLQTVYSLLAIGEKEQSLELLVELETKCIDVERIVYCKNPIVNIILSNKKREAISKGINAEIFVKEFPEKKIISDYELSSLLCNLFDNAIRGCEGCGKKELKFETKIKNQSLVIKMKNTCEDSLKVSDSRALKTTKNDAESHGLGLSIIENIINKYNGDFKVFAENGIFTVTIVIFIR